MQIYKTVYREDYSSLRRNWFDGSKRLNLRTDFKLMQKSRERVLQTAFDDATPQCIPTYTRALEHTWVLSKN